MTAETAPREINTPEVRQAISAALTDRVTDESQAIAAAADEEAGGG